MRRLFTLLLGLVCLAQASTAKNSVEQGAVTVRLFSTHTLREVTFIPLGTSAEMRSCPQCPLERITGPDTFKWTNGALHLTGNQHAHKQLELRGAFRVRADDASQQETAAGQWTINATATGLRILLTTPVERYVMAALNGEAAPNEPLESLKAMAVVARTFALVNAHRHVQEGFDLCDSTHCQALRFGSARPEVEEAAQVTTGESLWYESHRALAFATQHCGGEAEDASSVWPALRAPYLRAHLDPYCLRRSSASWHTDITIAQLTRILHEQHWNTPQQIEGIGIIKRTPTGRVQMLEISGQGVRSPISAASLHFALDRALGWNQLRSDWYEITLNNGTVHFEGKGYGHGVGLCQAGAFEMASEGRNYRQILAFYFPDANVRITPNDTGWKEISAAGWTLAATDAPQSFLQIGNAAWAKAQPSFPPKTSIHPSVRLMPSTELFRQATDEPGWALASTRGTRIALEPLSVLRAHNSESSTLLHEFLHVLVEQEATPQTPLWLREGLVEALADGHQHIRNAMRISEIETALAHPASETESQRAHAASGQLVQSFIDKYGFQTVRSWLRSGVPSTALAQ